MTNLPNIFKNTAITFIAGVAGSGKSVLLGCLLKYRKQATVFSLGSCMMNSDIYLSKKESGLFIEYNPLDFFDTAKESEILDVFKGYYKFNDKIENAHLYNHNYFIDSSKHAFIVDTVIDAIKQRDKLLFKNTYEFIDFILEKVSSHPEIKFSTLIPFLNSLKETPDNREKYIVFNDKVNSILLPNKYDDGLLIHCIDRIIKNIAKEIKNKRDTGDNSKVIICFDEIYDYLMHDKCDLKPLMMNNVHIVIVSHLLNDFVGILKQISRDDFKISINIMSYQQPGSTLERERFEFITHLNSVCYKRIKLDGNDTHVILDKNNHAHKEFTEKLRFFHNIHPRNPIRDLLYMSIPKEIHLSSLPFVQNVTWSINKDDLQLLRTDLKGRNESY